MSMSESALRSGNSAASIDLSNVLSIDLIMFCMVNPSHVAHFF